ncbi:hypothetical protein ABVC73_04265 [Prevotella melaninogenica]
MFFFSPRDADNLSLRFENVCISRRGLLFYCTSFWNLHTALNVAKIMCKELGTSIGRLKAQMVNAYYAQRIIDVFEKNPNTPLNKERINDIFSFDADAA